MDKPHPRPVPSMSQRARLQGLLEVVGLPRRSRVPRDSSALTWDVTNASRVWNICRDTLSITPVQGISPALGVVLTSSGQIF